jgi:hypothetical protein
MPFKLCIDPTTRLHYYIVRPATILYTVEEYVEPCLDLMFGRLYLTTPGRSFSGPNMSKVTAENVSFRKLDQIVSVEHRTNQHTTLESSRDTWKRPNMYVWRAYNRQIPSAYASMALFTNFLKSRK